MLPRFFTASFVHYTSCFSYLAQVDLLSMLFFYCIAYVVFSFNGIRCLLIPFTNFSISNLLVILLVRQICVSHFTACFFIEYAFSVDLTVYTCIIYCPRNKFNPIILVSYVSFHNLLQVYWITWLVS